MSTQLLIVEYSLLFLFFLSTTLFFYIVLRRIALHFQEVRFQRQYRTIEKDILQLITFPWPELSAEIARRYESRSRVLTQVLFDYIERIEGQGTDQLKKVFDYALKVHCLKDIYSRRLVKRLRATHLFVVFSEPKEAVHILKLLNDKPLVRLVAVKALSRIRTPQALSYIFQAFEEDDLVHARTYINILHGLGKKIEHFVRLELQKNLPAEKLGLLIELAGAVPLRSLYEDIVPFAEHPDKEIRAKVARALGNLRIPQSFELLLTLSCDPAWIVQAQAMKSLGKLDDPRALRTLADGLFSPFWHVRYNAGFSLASLGKPGIRPRRA
ncbi:MAG: HEAT repeat domain-containing protein, partial [Candidatus Aminicenantales bacterium]